MDAASEMFVYTSDAGSKSEEALQLLASRTATIGEEIAGRA